MGLDWIVESKPKPGCEMQYNTLSNLIAQADAQLDQLDSNSEEFAEALTKYHGMKEQLASVTITKYDTAKCPRVGKSKKAKQYFIDNHLPNLKNSHPKKTDEEIIGDFSDFHIVELSPYKTANTGFSGIMCSNLDFRGKGIGCSDLLSTELKEEAYEDHTPEESIDYASRLKTHLTQYKKSKLDDDQKEDWDFIMAGIKWLEFWGNRGHGYHAWF